MGDTKQDSIQPNKFRQPARALKPDDAKAAFDKRLSRVAAAPAEALSGKRALTRWENEGGAKERVRSREEG